MNWSGRQVAVASMCLASCSPALNWREVRPEGTELVLLFPCKPGLHRREVTLGPARVAMAMEACGAAGSTFVLGHADVVDPAQVGAALEAWRQASAANIGGDMRAEGPLQVPGMTPNDRAARWRIDGRLPGGEPTHVEAAFFVHGTRIYQASIVGPALDEGAIDIFESSLRFGG